MNQKTSRISGSSLVLIAAIIFSFGPLIFRQVEEADAWQFLFYRQLAGGGLSLLIFLYRRFKSSKSDFEFTLKEFLAGVLLSLMAVFYIFALQRTSSAFVMLLMSTSPIFATVFAKLILNERTKKKTILATVIVACGIAVMVAGEVAGGSLLGALFALLIPICLGLYSVFLRC